MHDNARIIIRDALADVQPDAAVIRALQGHGFPGRIIPVAVGKAAWQMAAAAKTALGDRLSHGVVITKYDHSRGPLDNIDIFEAGHPVPDTNTYRATKAALELVEGLSETDTVLFLLSGGGSALFEYPLIPEGEMADITGQLLAKGANIVEINTIRKRLSAVKGGKFALRSAPARVFSVILSDIVGDPIDMIASGPAAPDSSTCAMAQELAASYELRLSDKARELLGKETAKELPNVENHITGSVRELCAAAARSCERLGYRPVLLSTEVTGEARDEGVTFADKALEHLGKGEKLALIQGGETVVHLTGSGKGGRNQEFALAAAPAIAGKEGILVFSLGSDGTDGPTDAAGGLVDGSTEEQLRAKGLSVAAVLADNDSYHALKAIDALIMTGPTGTNVNDVAVALIEG